MLRPYHHILFLLLPAPVQDIVIEYATGVLGKAMDGAVGRGKLKPGARVASLGIGAEDIMYVVRKASRASEHFWLYLLRLRPTGPPPRAPLGQR
jgi:hypothetical protein